MYIKDKRYANDEETRGMDILEQQNQIYTDMINCPLWKCVTFGLICIEYEFDIYCRLAENRSFDMAKFLKKTVSRFWKAAATGYSMDEQYLLAIEESVFEPHDEWGHCSCHRA